MKKENFCTPTFAHRQGGVSLIEVLVTVLILSVGSLGIASLQLAGLKYSAGSYARTQVIILSDDMANRLKSNRTFALNAEPDGSFDAPSPYEMNAFAGTATVAKDCIVEQCTEQELANYDLASWVNEVARTIPSGQGRVQVIDNVGPNGIPNRQFSIELQWRQIANSTTKTGADADEIKSTAYRISL